MRNFGMTGSTAIEGANQPSSPHYRADTHPGSNVVPPLPGSYSLESPEVREPSLDERELGAGVIFLAVIIAPILFIVLGVLGYAALIAQAVED